MKQDLWIDTRKNTKSFIYDILYVEDVQFPIPKNIIFVKFQWKGYCDKEIAVLSSTLNKLTTTNWRLIP